MFRRIILICLCINDDVEMCSGAPQIDFSQVHIPGGGQPQGYGSMSEDPATLRELLLSSPHDVALLKERNPQLADALLSGNLGMTFSVKGYLCGAFLTCWSDFSHLLL